MLFNQGAPPEVAGATGKPAFLPPGPAGGPGWGRPHEPRGLGQCAQGPAPAAAGSARRSPGGSPPPGSPELSGTPAAVGLRSALAPLPAPFHRLEAQPRLRPPGSRSAVGAPDLQLRGTRSSARVRVSRRRKPRPQIAARFRGVDVSSSGNVGTWTLPGATGSPGPAGRSRGPLRCRSRRGGGWASAPPAGPQR